MNELNHLAEYHQKAPGVMTHGQSPFLGQVFILPLRIRDTYANSNIDVSMYILITYKMQFRKESSETNLKEYMRTEILFFT